jgi:hypothetical protein
MLAILPLSFVFKTRGKSMRRKLWLATAIAGLALAFAACNDATTNTNERANTGLILPATPAPTATPKYTEEQARDERARAKENKETVGQSLDDAWIHTKIVAKLIGDSQTPERKINVDVVNGDVTLRGTVDTNEAKAEAERVAKETDGVKKVTSQLKVAPGSAKPANTNKSTNTAKSKRSP